MKKLIILIIATFCFANNILSQIPYRPYSQYNGDKASYLKFNFDERGNLYQGKTFADLIKDIEITPIGYYVFGSISKVDNRGYVLGIDLYFSHYDNINYHPIKDIYLTIYWDSPILDDNVKLLEKQFPSESWVIQHYYYFQDKKIKMVKYKVL